MKPKFRSPKILLHPNIPKPLHSVNPRSVLGKAWWDEKRHAAYARNNYCCWACGVHKSAALYHRWLEGHEVYDYNYNVGSLTLKFVSALCHACHNFIHSGKLWMDYSSSAIDRERILTILNHGTHILEAEGLEPWWGTQMVIDRLDGIDQGTSLHRLHGQGRLDNRGNHLAWSDWHMIIEGVRYGSPFKNIEEWQAHYSNESVEE